MIGAPSSSEGVKGVTRQGRAGGGLAVALASAYGLATALGMGSGAAEAQVLPFDSLSSTSPKAAAPVEVRRAAPKAAQPQVINRSVLALFDGADEASPDRTRVHRMLEMPLNHLGYRVAYWDLRSGLPPIAEATRHAAIVTWFDERIPDHAAYLAWADAVARARVRFVVMEFTGAPLDSKSLPAVNRFLGHIGFQVRPVWVPDAPDLHVVAQSGDMLGFETRLEPPIPGFMVYELAGPNARAHLTVARPGPVDARSSTPVVTSRGGGFAASGYAIRYDAARQRLAWVLDPFKFLAAALGPEDAPIPDTTTIAGRRIYFSHIDGDGWNNPSFVPSEGRPPALASERVLDDLIRPYPDLPVSVGLIAADADPAIGGTARAQNVARAFYALPQVEVASHTYTHPYDWSFFASQNRQRELAVVAGRKNELELQAIAPHAVGIDQAFLSGSATTPRANMLQPFDLDMEVRKALDLAGALAPPGKRPALYLWSGNTRPFAAAVRATRAYGVRNLNGGDGRLDSLYPSVAYLSALSRPVGGERQIYAPNANETIYTGGWVAPFDRFAMLAETVRNTELPRRLKPWNLYYHMYSGQRSESLAVVKAHLDAARAAAVIPIKASHYAAIVDSFHEVAIARLGQGKWRIEKRGVLGTVRFDAAEHLAIDWSSSAGVLGATRHAGALYVALDPAVAQPVIAVARGGKQAGSRVNLVESRWQVSELRPARCGFDAKVAGFGRGDMTWAGLRPGAYAVSVRRGRDEVARVSDVADAFGTMRLALSADAAEGLQLEVRCAS